MRRVTLEQLLAEAGVESYTEQYRYIRRLLEEGRIRPVKQSPRNGRTPALHLAYWQEEEETEKESADRQQETGKPESGETEQLDGNVRGIGDNGIVIIKVKTEELEDGVSLAIQPASGNETAEDYVDVNFTDDTTFELHVVKNGGVNPDEDVTVKEASISDIVGDMSVTLEGYYDGEVFVAGKVVLYEFV